MSKTIILVAIANACLEDDDLCPLIHMVKMSFDQFNHHKGLARQMAELGLDACAELDESENPECVMTDYIDNLQKENAQETATHFATITSYYSSRFVFRYTIPTTLDKMHNSFDYDTISG